MNRMIPIQEDKLYIAADFHGGIPAIKRLLTMVSQEKSARLLIAGDLALRTGNASAILPMLRSMRGKITAVRGNCDSVGTEKELDVPMPIAGIYSWNGRTLMMKHIPNEVLPILPPESLFIFGHTHFPLLYKDMERSIFVLNPGSACLPGGGFPPTYAVAAAHDISICSLADHSILKRLELS